MALVLPSAITRNAILLPAYQETFPGLKLSREDGLVKSIVLTLGLLNPFASSALMTGGLAPMTTATLLGGFSWWRWFFLMSVPYYALLMLGGFWTYWINPSPQGRLNYGAGRSSLPSAGKEMRVIAILVLTTALWFTDFWHGLNPAVPALLAAVLFASPGRGPFLEGAGAEHLLVHFLRPRRLPFPGQSPISTGAAAWFAELASHRPLPGAGSVVSC